MPSSAQSGGPLQERDLSKDPVSNRWWRDSSDEVYWMEVTRREDLAAYIEAPATNEKGKPYWGYSLIHDLEPGDLVFHYDGAKKAIAAVSRVREAASPRTITWAARGTSARQSGATPRERPGFRVETDEFRWLPHPVSLSDIRARRTALQGIKERIENENGRSSYFPFQFTTPMKAQQGYLLKVPREVVGLFPSMRDAIEPHMVDGDFRQDQFGRPYQAAPEVIRGGTIQAEYDSEAQRLGTEEHNQTQNGLATILSDFATVRSSRRSEPEFDLAFRTQQRLYVVEVKSLGNNEARQLRLGLGQVLEYSHRMRLRENVEVVPVLATSLRPSDECWFDICDRAGVLLTSGPGYRRLLDHIKE